MTDLGPGWANGINDVGQIVGTDGQHAVLWENGGMVDLGWGKASSINHAGQIVGDGAASGEIHGFLWYDGNATDLGTWANDTSSQAVGINRDGQAVGFSGDQAHAVLWTLPRIAPPPPRFPMRDLGFLPGPYNSSSIAYGVNDVGQVVGAGWGANGVGGHAFLWTNGTMTDLGTLGGTQSGRAFLWTNGTMTDLGPSGAYAINNAGKIVGVSGPHASVWNNGAMTDLGTLGGLSSDAYGINEAGQIVGGSDSGSGSRAFLWDNGTMTDLGTLVSDIGSWSYGVSNVGQAVGVSYAPYGASTSFHAVIWTIPRPEVHDVAVSSASASATAADVGVSMRITATVVNRGTQPESFDVSAYAGSVLVGTKAVTDLASGASQDISFSWDTSSAAPGSYPVRVEASPVSGETNIANNVASGLTVRLAPPVTAQASGTPSATDVGKAISFSCSPTDGTPPYQFFWDFGDGSQWTDSTATHTFTVSGTKSATCTITDSAGKESTSSTTVLVNPVPSVTVSVNHASAGRGAVVTFSAQVAGGTGTFDYVWDFGDDIGGTGATVTHSYATAGGHRASVIVTDTVRGTAEGSVTLTVSDLVITSEASRTQAVTGEAISFTGSATGGAGGPYAYSWDFGDGKTETGATVTHSYATAGTFTPKVTVRDASGFSQEKTLSPIIVQVVAPSTSTSSGVPVPIAGGLAVIVIVALLGWAVLRRKGPAR